MFSIVPRYDDDFNLFRLADDFVSPLNTWQRSLQPMLREVGSVVGRESEVQDTDKEYRIRLDLRHFKPEEVKITSDKDKVTIHAKHEEKQDNHGFVSREMTRVYSLPKDVDPQSVTSTMNSQGTLSIKAAKQAIEAPKDTPIAVEFKNK